MQRIQNSALVRCMIRSPTSFWNSCQRKKIGSTVRSLTTLTPSFAVGIIRDSATCDRILQVPSGGSHTHGSCRHRDVSLTSSCNATIRLRGMQRASLKIDSNDPQCITIMIKIKLLIAAMLNIEIPLSRHCFSPRPNNSQCLEPLARFCPLLTDDCLL